MPFQMTVCQKQGDNLYVCQYYSLLAICTPFMEIRDNDFIAIFVGNSLTDTSNDFINVMKIHVPTNFFITMLFKFVLLKKQFQKSPRLTE